MPLLGIKDWMEQRAPDCMRTKLITFQSPKCDLVLLLTLCQGSAQQDLQILKLPSSSARIHEFLACFGVCPGPLQPRCGTDGCSARALVLRKKHLLQHQPREPLCPHSWCSHKPASHWNSGLGVLQQPTNVWGGEGEWKNNLFISGD